MTSISHTDLKRHLEAFWPGSSVAAFEWTLGPVGISLPGFRVLRVSPTANGQPWVYVSSGAAKVKTAHGERYEFFLTAPQESPAHIETLAMVSHFHADPAYGLHLGKVIDIGRPWVNESELDCLLVSLPFPYGPKLERCTLSGKAVRLLWLLPIRRAEADFARRNGADALEQQFDRAAINYLDIHRPSVV
jgi:hypothetical protein